MANPFVHIELQTKDLAKAKDFYSRLFDWKLENLPVAGDDMPYTMIDVGEGTGGGMYENQDPKVPPHWLAYVGGGRHSGLHPQGARTGRDRAAGCDADRRPRLDQRHPEPHRRSHRHVAAQRRLIGRFPGSVPCKQAPDHGNQHEQHRQQKQAQAQQLEYPDAGSLAGPGFRRTG